MWKPIILDGKETKYAVSDKGKILNTKTNKILSTWNKTEGGYLRVNLYNDGKLYARLVHVLVAEAFIPKPKVDPDTKLEVNHKDGKKDNPAASNLEWATRAENIMHAVINRLMSPKRGIEHGMCNTSEDTVKKVCEMLQEKKHPREISEELDVPESLPASIKYFGAWRHIACKYNIPKPGEVEKGPRRHPERSKIYTPETIHKVCQLLEDGYTDREIVELTKVAPGFSSDIKRRRIWNYYSDQYNIPYPGNLSRHDYYLKRVTDLVNNGVTSHSKIILRLGLPDTQKNKEFLIGIYNEIKQRASSTIEHSGVGEIPSSTSK